MFYFPYRIISNLSKKDYYFSLTSHMNEIYHSKRGESMAHVGSKGYYVKKLKEKNIRLIEGRRLEQYKTYFLVNYYKQYIKNHTE